LSDAGSATITAYGILNPAVEWAFGPDKDDPAVAAEVRKYVSGVGANKDMAGMAFPGTFMLDRNGRVTSRFFEDFYVDRTTASSVMARLGAGTTPVAATKISTGQLDITTFPSDTAVAPGNQFSLIVDVSPHPGIHVYAPGASDYRVITVSIAQPFVQVRPIRYPSSEIYFFKPLNERVPVFRKPFRLIQDVLLEGTPQAQAALQGKESITLTGSVEYQACDDTQCFNPATVPVTWTLTLRTLVRERPALRGLPQRTRRTQRRPRREKPTRHDDQRRDRRERNV